MSRKRRKRTRDHRAATDVDNEAEMSTALAPRRRKRLRRRLVALVLLLFIAIAAAPTILSRTDLRNALLAQVMPPTWHVECEQAHFGWLTNQSLGGITVTDTDGKQLLAVESLTLPKPLLSLAFNRNELGDIKLVRPTATVETRPDGSNWEDFIGALQAMQQEPATEPISLSIEVVEGAVRGTDVASGQQWSIEDANIMAAIGDSIEARGSAELLADQGQQRGKLSFRLQPQQGDENRLEVLAERLPLRVLQPWLDRFANGTQVAGLLSTDASISWHNDSQRGLTLTTIGRLEASQLEVEAAALDGDRLRGRSLTAPWEISLAGDDLSVRRLQLDSDVAKLDVSGKLSLGELQSLSLADLLKGQLPKREAQLTGDVDLAKLAAMLPRKLQLRKGVRIDAGNLTFKASGQTAGDQFNWQAAATVANVAGTDGQRQIRWQQPIEARVDLREVATGAQLETMTVSAPFANASMRTQQDSITGDFEVDLGKLSQELSQFVDMQAWQLRGLGEGKFTLARQRDQQFSANADLQLTDLHVDNGDREVWTEPKLEVSISAAGEQQEFTPTALTSGKLQLRGPRDQLEASLLQPVKLDQNERSYQLQIESNGPLEMWASRLQPWLPGVPDTLQGDAHVQAQVQLAGGAIKVIQSAGSVVQLQLRTDALAIEEPRVEFSGSGIFDLQSRVLKTPELQLLGSSFSFRARDVDVVLNAGGNPTTRGNVAFRADLERLATMAKLVGGPQSTWPRGTAVGQLKLASNADQLQADISTTVEQLQLVRTTAAAGAVYGQPEVVWSEPSLQVSGVAKYATAADHFQVEKLQVVGKTLQLSSSATIQRVSTEALLQANGLVEYAPEELAKLVASFAGQEVQLQGDRQVRFQLAGPLRTTPNAPSSHWTHSWDVTGEAGWSSAGVYGLPLGGGKLKGSLRDGQLQIEPLDVAVGEGRFTAQPLVRLTPDAQQLVLRPGPLVTNVSISPEVSEQMLKYVAPILAGATRTEGEFSVELAQAEVPFGDPEQSRVQGKLTTHRLAVSPGPMMNQLIALVKQVESLSKRKQFLQAAVQPRTKSFLTMVEQEIEFQVVEGRVYHRNLEFLVDDAPVRSYGSVGFDQTLALMIEIPIQDKWIEDEPALRGFAGQSLRLPIYGTFQKPRIDERAIADLTRQLLQGAARQALGDELNRQFEKLFRGD